MKPTNFEQGRAKWLAIAERMLYLTLVVTGLAAAIYWQLV
jgi:hypothetical protein